MTALIIEDELLNRLTLRKMIGLYCPQITIIHEASNIEEGKSKTILYQPDIVFLDVEMPPNTGFQYLKSLVAVNFELVFVTAFNHYAMEAIKFSALDYILKPVDIDELILAVKKAEENIRKKVLFDQKRLEVLFQDSKPLESIIINSLKESKVVSISNILYAKAEDTYTNFFLSNHEKIVSTKHLMEYEKLLGSYRFFRVHKSYLINLNKVDKIVKGDHMGLQLINGEIIPIARRRKDELIELISK